MPYMNTVRITTSILIVVAVLLIVWDVYAALNGVKGDTISAVIYEASVRLSFIPYAWGCLTTHFFCSVKRPIINTWLMVGLLIAVGVALNVVGLMLGPPDWWTIFSLIVGAACGRFWVNMGKDGE